MDFFGQHDLSLDILCTVYISAGHSSRSQGVLYSEDLSGVSIILTTTAETAANNNKNNV